MSRPRPPGPAGPALEPLIDLVAGREPGTEDPETTLAAAIEHGADGLLADAVIAGQLDLSARWTAAITARGLELQRQRDEMAVATGEVAARLAHLGVESVVVKGAVTEHRWWPRPGSRPFDDVDLLLAPGAHDALPAVLAELRPGWRPPDELTRLVADGHVQSLTLADTELSGVDRPVDVDLHFDLLKLGVASPAPDRLWAGRSSVEIEGVGAVTVLDPDAAALHHLIHLNKDRFTHLRGFADIALALRSSTVDWDRVLDLARVEDVATIAGVTLRRVTDVLDLPPVDWPATSGVRSRIWHRLWPAGDVLSGDLGRASSTRRWFWLALLTDGRPRGGLRWLARHALPPRGVIELNMPEAEGSYLRRLVVGRGRHAVRRRRQRLDLDRSA